MKSLQTRKDIVIKPADKGGSVCVWDKTLNIQEAETQLSSTQSCLCIIWKSRYVARGRNNGTRLS